MFQEQLIQNPFGITVFGSAHIRVEPDMVWLHFAVSSTQPHPKNAFQEVRKTSLSIREYLQEAGVHEVKTSRVSVSQTFRFASGERKPIGYTAKAVFSVRLQQLDQLEELLSGIVDAGANEIQEVEFQTTRLNEIRAEARGQAIQAAREKAEQYCNAAGVTLGQVIHIEDLDPETLDGRARHLEESGPAQAQAFDPGSINVGAAVILAFKLQEDL